MMIQIIWFLHLYFIVYHRWSPANLRRAQEDFLKLYDLPPKFCLSKLDKLKPTSRRDKLKYDTDKTWKNTYARFFKFLQNPNKPRFS